MYQLYGLHYIKLLIQLPSMPVCTIRLATKKLPVTRQLIILVSTVSRPFSRFSKLKFIIYGDFNDLCGHSLNQVSTNVNWCVNTPESTLLPAPPEGRSDHNSIILASSSRNKFNYTALTPLILFLTQFHNLTVRV